MDNLNIVLPQLIDKLLKALERAAAKVAENARKNKYKIPVWKNGRIEYEIPGIITEQTSAPDVKSRGI